MTEDDKTAVHYGQLSNPGRRHAGDRPQIIAHRGFRARFPENTMLAFEGAVKAGAHAIETDVHLSKDGVVVLCHDSDLFRCFGVHKNVVDCEWSYLRTLRTIAEPAQPMATLDELLHYLARDEMARSVWLLLDIKRDNDATKIIRRMAETIAKVPLSDGHWRDRIFMGCWTENYVPLVESDLSGFPVAHIGISNSYARRFLRAPGVAFNMNIITLLGPGGSRFIKEMRGWRNRPVWTWTVNSKWQMEWSIQRGLDGIITDDPALCADACRNFDESKPEESVPIYERLMAFYVWILAAIFGAWFRSKHDGGRSRSTTMERVK